MVRQLKQVVFQAEAYAHNQYLLILSTSEPIITLNKKGMVSIQLVFSGSYAAEQLGIMDKDPTGGWGGLIFGGANVEHAKSFRPTSQRCQFAGQQQFYTYIFLQRNICFFFHMHIY